MGYFARISVICVLLVAGAVSSAPVWAQQQTGPYWGPHMWNSGGGPGGFFFGPLMMVFVIALSVAAVVLLIRWLSPGGRHEHRRRNTPLVILEERFARGEIDRAEFEERKKILGA